MKELYESDFDIHGHLSSNPDVMRMMSDMGGGEVKKTF
jgi:hypothetical protein